MKISSSRILWFAVALSCASLPARAAAQAVEVDLLDSLSAGARAKVFALRDSASAEGLPTFRLLSTARRGVAMKVSEAQITAAVEDYFRRLRVSRTALGTGAAAGEVEAGALALGGRGIDARALERLRAQKGKASLEVPLSVLTYLVGSGMAPRAATDLVVDLAAKEVSDLQLVRFQSSVDQDIKIGMVPTQAAMLRAAEVMAEALTLRDQNAGPRRNAPPPLD